MHTNAPSSLTHIYCPDGPLYVKVNNSSEEVPGKCYKWSHAATILLTEPLTILPRCYSGTVAEHSIVPNTGGDMGTAVGEGSQEKDTLLASHRSQRGE